MNAPAARTVKPKLTESGLMKSDSVQTGNTEIVQTKLNSLCDTVPSSLYICVIDTRSLLVTESQNGNKAAKLATDGAHHLSPLKKTLI